MTARHRKTPRARVPWSLAAIAAVIAGLAVLAGTGSASGAAAQGPACAVTGSGPYQECVTMPYAHADGGPEAGLVVQGPAGPGSYTATEFQVQDRSGAWMEATNGAGTYFAGNGITGEACLTDGLTKIFCAEPDGTLILATVHPDGTVSDPVVVTSQLFRSMQIVVEQYGLPTGNLRVPATFMRHLDLP